MCDRWNLTIAMLPQMARNQRTLNDECCDQYDEKWNGFAEVAAFCHTTCRYFDSFLLQGVDRNWHQACIFYLAPGLIREGCWQVNS